MLKVRVNPLVVAAALGLLGPAAMEEDEPTGPVGLWQRAEDGTPGFPGRLGERIEVLAIEDRVYVDGGDGAGPLSDWTWPNSEALVVSRQVEDAAIRQELRATGPDGLDVVTWVGEGDDAVEIRERYRRLG